jgi:tetratricopeptide (TPR) repeat protein
MTLKQIVKKSCWILILVVGILFVTEYVLRIIPTTKHQLFMQSSNSGLFQLNIEFEGQFSQINSASPKTFKKVKDENCFRIFILGQTPDNMKPSNPGGDFGHLLNYQLQQTFRNKEIELINIPAVGSSFQMLKAAKQLKRYQPDLVILCPGKDEFYNRQAYPFNSFTGNRKADNFIQELYIFQLVNRIVPLQNLSNDVTSNSKLYENVTETFESRLDRTVLHLQREDIPILLINTACNLLDTAPLSKGFSSTDSIALKKLLEEGKKAYHHADYDLAYTCFDKIYRKQKTHAETLYYLGKLAFQLSDYKEAKKLFRQSADYDCYKIRPTSHINNSIFRIATIRECPLINMEDLFFKNSASGIPGYDLFSDQNNTNLKGNLILTDACLKTILNHKFLGTTDIPGLSAINSLTPFDIVCDQLKSVSQNQNEVLYGYIKPQNITTSFEEKTARLFADEKSSWEDSMNKLYNYYLSSRNYKLAFKVIENLALENPYNIGISRKAYQTAAMMGDSQLVVHYASKVYAIQRDFDTAKQLFLSYLKLDKPENALPYLEYARQNARQNNLNLIYTATTQIIELKKILQQNPGNREVKRRIAEHYLAMGNEEVARWYAT